jgi:hypothetical protein
MPTVKEAIVRLEAHEKECLIRYKSIEKQLDAGNKKFDKLDKRLWFLYPLVIASPLLEKLFQ